MKGHVFISHSSDDDATVAAVREALRAHGIAVWDDARGLAAGDQLEAEIRAALEGAAGVIAVLSPRTINSTWVTEEIRYALALQRARGADAYRVIPVMLDGIRPPALRHWFGEERLGISLEAGPGGVQSILPALLAGLGLALPTETTPGAVPRAVPLADLTLELCDPFIERAGGTHRGAATAELIYRLVRDGVREVRSARFQLVAPLGPIESEDLRWYLERYVHWPSGVFRERAQRVEALLPQWGRRLHEAALENEAAREVVAAWRSAGEGVARRFTVLVDRDLIAGAHDAARQAAADEGATLLLGLPWELLRDDEGYLFHGAQAVRVRRRLPNRKPKAALVTSAPLRVLLVSPRPEDDRAGYIDHRVSARPVVEALAELGELAEVTLLRPPTFKALGEELTRARGLNAPYHVVHFDGHGVYSPQTGLGALCFEHADDSARLDGRRSDLVDAATLAEKLRDLRVPLFFLEACQSAQAGKDPTSSVAGRLLQGGVASVVAMSHSVLVETARRFVTAFYRELLAGQRIGAAMVAGQRALQADSLRLRTFAGELRLHDWFVPVLYQEEDDPPVIHAVPAEAVRAVLARQRELSLGELPRVPEHGFVGRSRELLRAERLLEHERYVVLLGEGGEGKTTLAAELARWLVLTERFERAAFAALDVHGDARALLMELGRQLVPGFVVLVAQDAERAWLALERDLAERRTLLVLDNLETVLPPEADAPTEGAFEPQVLAGVLQLAARLQSAGATRVVFTSRQALPEPFAAHALRIGRLERSEAVELVASVLGRREQAPRADDPGESDDEITRLVDVVGCHARSLSLLAREVAASGVRVTTERLGELMARLHARHPGDRERSLYASVELSLRRLPAGLREAIRPLGMFQGGVNIASIAFVLGLNIEQPGEVHALGEALVNVGLAEMHEHGYLRLDPALGPLLLSEMSDAERAAATDRWAQAMAGLAKFLEEQQMEEHPEIAGALMQCDLANFLGALEHIANAAPVALAVDVVTTVEKLLQNLGRPRALARVARIRERLAAELTVWDHARFTAAWQAVDRLHECGRSDEAIAAAQTMLQRAQAAGDSAYEGASYDLAMAHAALGRVLHLSGHAEAALVPLDEACRRFRDLADSGGAGAARMAAALIDEVGHCLMSLHRFGEAASAYEAALGDAESRNDTRSIAGIRFNLGTVRMNQGRYVEALVIYDKARLVFESLGDMNSVATAWHQIGIVRRRTGQYDDAEKAYQASLRLRVQAGDRSHEAGALMELGTLYAAMGRLEDAVRFHQQAAATYRDLRSLANEGRTCNNLAETLVELGRYDDARREILRAIECMQSFGHAAEPWKTFNIRTKIERATGDAVAAEAARQQAINAYLAYRRDGGESYVPGAKLCAVTAQAIAGNEIPAALAGLTEVEQRSDLPTERKPLIPKLRAILEGSRDPALAADPALHYSDAAELLLLLDHLTPNANA